MPNDDRAHLRHILNSDGTLGYTAVDGERLLSLQAENAQLRAERERVRQALEQVAAEQRAACAKVADDFADHCPFYRLSQEQLCRRIAHVIRALGDQARGTK